MDDREQMASLLARRIVQVPISNPVLFRCFLFCTVTVFVFGVWYGVRLIAELSTPLDIAPWRQPPNIDALPGRIVWPSYPIFPRPLPSSAFGSNNNNDTNNATMKVILLWTKLFGRPDWRLGSTGQEPFLNLSCPIANCIITNNRTLLDKADVLLFSIRDDFNFSYPDLPSAEERNPSQRWTFVLWESPEHTYTWKWRLNRKHHRNLKDFPNFFNWTMTYRLDSDVTFNYGRFIPRQIPDFSRVGFDRLANKTRTAIFINSHCDTPSRREILAERLSEYIDVDTIGKCNSSVPNLTNGTCARETFYTGTPVACLRQLSSTYKFYLSFENSLCRDYITEKFYRAAKMDLIPVVYNGADMSQFAPPHSFIDAQQFSSTAKLADFLKKVGSDPALYNAYFWWKPFYDVEHMWEQVSFRKHFCDLCAKINYYTAVKADERKSYADIDAWWTTQGNCRDGKTSF